MLRLENLTRSPLGPFGWVTVGSVSDCRWWGYFAVFNSTHQRQLSGEFLVGCNLLSQIKLERWQPTAVAGACAGEQFSGWQNEAKKVSFTCVFVPVNDPYPSTQTMRWGRAVGLVSVYEWARSLSLGLSSLPNSPTPAWEAKFTMRVHEERHRDRQQHVCWWSAHFC